MSLALWAITYSYLWDKLEQSRTPFLPQVMLSYGCSVLWAPRTPFLQTSHFTFWVYRVSLYLFFSVQGRASPVHCLLFPTMPFPLRRMILRCCSKFSATSLAFVLKHGTRLPLVLLRDHSDDAAGFTSCCGLVGCSHGLTTVLLSMRFYTQISPCAGILATRGLGPSRDRTFTG